MNLGVLIVLVFSGAGLLLINFIKLRTTCILKEFEGHQIVLKDYQSNFFGQLSLKSKQIRGNGLLLLSNDRLFFEMYLPRKKLIIPLKNIRLLKTPRFFMDKSKMSKLLQVDFINVHGQKDSAAWAVKDLTIWLKELKNKGVIIA